ncbi:MAG: tRNA 5-methoxyuridine(34)/uridine 5-oxyacetic acid(34) synthase CmoB [Mariniblastus sp.]|nr:tRNA 5-methoxyuridine(34)/uridine 5-oxyacetic acid(34) synthase CmoB [Mariniblastus sp.]
MLFWQRPDLVQTLLPNVDAIEVQQLRNTANKKLKTQQFTEMADAIAALPTPQELTRPIKVDLSGPFVEIGKFNDLNAAQHSQLQQTIDILGPWRKGPFRLFDKEIDAEWKSNLKWSRIENAIGELKGRQILDVGCGNGYYMFRAAHGQPKSIIGLDPSVTFYCAFELMQRFLQMKHLQYERLGVEHLYVFDQAFDIAMCMGILYHHRSPIEILRNLRQTLKVGGVAIIESQTIPGNGSVALFPEDRYAKARNVFFVPTKDCLVNWVRRSGFKNVEVVSHLKVTPEEQRTTKDMTWESLADFLNPADPNLTIEGHPAPYRTVIRAERQFL